MKRFPEGFLWGSASSAHQVEGGNSNSDCWLLENIKPSIFRERSGDAVDHWSRFEADVALLAAMGLKFYRFSVEWAKIEPDEGCFSQSVLDHYQRCIDACWRHGVEPMITFHHFSGPIWMARKGGVTAPEFPEYFARYCEHTTRALRGFEWACTINELNVPILVHNLVAGQLEQPAAAPVKAAAETVLGGSLGHFFLTTPRTHLLENGLGAHFRARDAIKGVRPEISVGLSLSIQDEQADPGGEPTRDARLENYVLPFLDAVKGDDYIGVQTYTRYVSKADGTYGPEPGHATTTMGFEDRPTALAEVCRLVWERTRTPIFVTENGWAGVDDGRRAAFIEEALERLHDVIEEGADIRGYLYWTLLDNFEWLSGFEQQFGLISVDRTTQRRLMKPSSLVFGGIAQANALGKAGPSEKFATKVGPRSGAPLGLD